MSKHPKYSEEVLEALRESIKKWEGIAYRGGLERESYDCPLCKLFLWNKNCRGCPVFNETGRPVCIGTPYEIWLKNTDFTTRKVVHDSSEQAAKNFLNWLRDLYTKVTEKGREIVSTGRLLSISGLTRELNKDSQKEIELFCDFFAWAIQRFDLYKTISLSKDSILQLEFIPQHPDFGGLLVRYGFAKWAEPESSKQPEFKSFTIEVRTLEEAQELWHRLNTPMLTLFDLWKESDMPFDRTKEHIDRLWNHINDELISQGFRK